VVVGAVVGADSPSAWPMVAASAVDVQERMQAMLLLGGATVWGDAGLQMEVRTVSLMRIEDSRCSPRKSQTEAVEEPRVGLLPEGTVQAWGPASWQVSSWG
jgi:hypothetical protein